MPNYSLNEQKILLIDDDTDLLQLISVIFKNMGAQVSTARDGLEGISKMFTQKPHLIILDVMLPAMDGFEICRRIRQVSNTPIIMLTALNQERDMLRGLEAGADDFLSKPVNTDILLARSRSVLRRAQQTNVLEDLFYYNDGHLHIDIEKHEVLIKGSRIKLTPLEFRLLVYLARNAGKVLTSEQILANVWGNEYQGNIDHVHVYVSHLRKKLEENTKSPRYIVTLYGIGYIFEKHELEYKSQ